VVVGVSSASPEKNRELEKLGKLSMRIPSDLNHEHARRFASYDDFEDQELHSTILIDVKGRVHWKRTGGDPFDDVEFLMKSVKRLNEQNAVEPTAAAAGLKQGS
jgi:peroxiredoxin